MLTLGQAARLAGTSKTTLTRSIKSGRLSAIRLDDGSYQIDPAELCRVYAVRIETPVTVSATGGVVKETTPLEGPSATPCDPEVTARLAALDAEVLGLRELLAEVKSNRDELRAERDDWRGRAERLLTDQRPSSVWHRLFG